MTGIFDSGVGGLVSLRRLRELCPSEDIIYLSDDKNAPYGTKDMAHIKKIVRNNIDRLVSLGAGRVLIACCTASCVLPLLEEGYRNTAMAIIRPAAEEAVRISSRGRIGVISTDATARFDSFAKEIKSIRPDAEVFTISTAELVQMVQSGCTDENMTRRCYSYLQDVSAELKSKAVDALILGCTHFSHVRRTLEDLLGICTVSPAHIGAELVAKDTVGGEAGRTIYIN